MSDGYVDEVRAAQSRTGRVAGRARAAALVATLAAAAMPASALADRVGDFAFGQLQGATVGAAGCGTNGASEPALRISPTGNLFLGSERGLGQGSLVWRGLAAGGQTPLSNCGLEFRGQPNGSRGTGAGGGDIDLAIAPARNEAGTHTLYVASLNGGSVSVATSTDDGATFSNSPVQSGLPLDDREWIAAYSSATSLLTFTDAVTANIDVLRSTDGGKSYTQVSQVLPIGPLGQSANQIGNLAIDRFSGLAYQSYMAPSSPSGTSLNEFFVAVSRDLGATWSQSPIPCSISGQSLDHSFPNITLDPSTGRIWAAWSDDTSVFTAVSDDQARSWTCSSAVSPGLVRAIFPWIAARNGGADLVFYGTPDRSTNPTWYVQFAQNLDGRISSWAAPAQLMAVHTGDVCEQGANCTSQRQLFEDFAVDVDGAGLAHIAYSHDAPNLGDQGSYTGYAVQSSGRRLGTAAPDGTTGRGMPSGSGDGSAPVTLPPGGACLRRRFLSLRLHRPRDGRIRGVTVVVNGRRVRRLHRDRARRVRIDLRRVPPGTVRVRVIVKVSQGGHLRSLTSSRTYRTCPRRRRR